MLVNEVNWGFFAEYTVFLFYCTGVDKKARLMAENDCYRGDWSNKASDSNCGCGKLQFSL